MTAIPEVTVSGNEVTDVVRQAALEGDGQAYPDSSYGIWEATINLITNGGFETVITGWNDSGATGTRVTAQKKFGGASGQYVTDNAGANEGGYHAFAGAAATQYTVSAWVRGTAGGETVRVALYDDVSGKQASSPVTLTTGWQRVTVTATTGGGSAVFRAYIETDAQQNITFNIDGVQAEAQPIATPYVETDGGTAGRSNCRVQMPVSLIDETQAWFAVYMRMNWDWDDEPAANPINFRWQDDGTHRIGMYFETGAGRWGLLRMNGGGEVVVFQNNTFSRGDEVLVIGAWTAAAIKISVNGAGFTSAAHAVVPTLSATTFEIGAAPLGTAQHLDGDILWAACGTGVLTDADAAAIAALGGGAPPSDMVPSAAELTAIWYANNPEYFVPPEREDSYKAMRGWMGG